MFTPRIEMPKPDNPYYIPKSAGGLNPCLVKPAGSPLRFANCVFYAVGRFAEVTGIWLPSANAEDFCTNAKKMGLTITQNPALGCIAVWAKGEVGNGADGAGHVACVEIVNAAGSIVTSESGWNAKQEFWTQTRLNDGNWGQPAAYRFLGFILAPVSDVPTGVIRKGDTGSAVRWMQERLAEKGYLRSSEIDGDFGRITLGAACAFQLESGLEVDGVCGPLTRAKLSE